MAKRQLRELQRLMAWSWDSRVGEHPPGEKAMHDFENVLNFTLDTRRRPRTSTATTPGAAAANPVVHPSSVPLPVRRGSADRGMKRASPGPASADQKAGRKGGKAARVEPSPAATLEQQQQQAHASPLAPGPEQQPAAVLDAAAAEERPADVAAAGSPQGPPEATPAVRQPPQQPAAEQQQEGRSPALPGSCTAATPAAALLSGLAATPAATVPTGPSTAGGAVALADAQFLPTPAPTPLPMASVLRQSSGVPAAGEQSAEAALGFRQPAPRCVLTSQKVKAAAAEPGAMQLPEQEQQEAAVVAAGETAAPADADTAAAGPEPMSVDESPAPAVPAALLAAAEAQAAAALEAADSCTAPTPAVAVLPSHMGVATGAVEVPTPVMQAFAAADQLVYYHPRPATCPPLFKPAAKSPLGKRRSPGSCPPAGKSNKENRGGLNGSAATGRLTPRTAEPVVPQPVVLSAWKQQQLAALSAGFHTRQRRLLELLSACNRVQALAQTTDSPALGDTTGELVQKPLSGAKSGRGAAKPPLGPRAAAVVATSTWAAAGEGVRPSRGSAARALGRLRDQQAV